MTWGRSPGYERWSWPMRMWQEMDPTESSICSSNALMGNTRQTQGLPRHCLSLEKLVYSPTACLRGCSHGKATGLNAQGLYCPEQTAHSCGAQKPAPPWQQLSVGLHCGPLTWLAILLASAAQLDSLLGPPGKAVGATCNHKVPRCFCTSFQPWSTSAPWLAACAAYMLCFWATLSRTNCMPIACFYIGSHHTNSS